MFFRGSSEYATTMLPMGLLPALRRSLHVRASDLEAIMPKQASTKMLVYQTLYRMNVSFAHIVMHCRALGECRILSPKFTRLYQSYAQELQAEINQDVIETMNEIEFDDWAQFGKARAAREKELRDPDDVFIEAEERRRELAQQAKRSKHKRNKATTAQSKTGHQHRKTRTGRTGSPSPGKRKK
jgi:hypothetical protein